jgi:hypothetical protein
MSNRYSTLKVKFYKTLLFILPQVIWLIKYLPIPLVVTLPKEQLHHQATSYLDIQNL